MLLLASEWAPPALLVTPEGAMPSPGVPCAGARSYELGGEGPWLVGRALYLMMRRMAQDRGASNGLTPGTADYRGVP